MSMEPLEYAGSKAPKRGGGFKGLALIGGALATVAALGVGAVLAVFFAATVVVIGLMAVVLIGLGSLAYRARKATRTDKDPDIIEARHISGHSWVAYGWDQRGR